jgi:hypothetical protein
MGFIRRAIAAVLLGAAFSAHAVFIAHDSQFGASTLIEDSNTGLSWLRLDVTRGMSYDSVYNQLDTTFAGFHIAGSEIYGLMNSLGLLHEQLAYYAPAMSDTQAFETSSAMTMLGQQNSGLRGFASYGGASYYSEDGNLRNYYLQGFGAYLVGNRGAWYDDAAPMYKMQAYANFSTFLVMAPPVPEPAPLLLMAGGIAALILHRRRRQVVTCP